MPASAISWSLGVMLVVVCPMDAVAYLAVGRPFSELRIGRIVVAGTWRLMRLRHVKPAILACAR